MFAKRFFHRTNSEAETVEAGPAPAAVAEEKVDGVEDAQDLPEEGSEVKAVIPEVCGIVFRSTGRFSSQFFWICI